MKLLVRIAIVLLSIPLAISLILVTLAAAVALTAFVKTFIDVIAIFVILAVSGEIWKHKTMFG